LASIRSPVLKLLKTNLLSNHVSPSEIVEHSVRDQMLGMRSEIDCMQVLKARVLLGRPCKVNKLEMNRRAVSRLFCNFGKSCVNSRSEADSPLDLLEAWIITQGVEVGPYLDKD
jgi:hypothetical protein